MGRAKSMETLGALIFGMLLWSLTDGSEIQLPYQIGRLWPLMGQRAAMRKKRDLIREFCTKKLTTKLPPELIMIILEFCFDVKIGRTTTSYWLFLGPV